MDQLDRISPATIPPDLRVTRLRKAADEFRRLDAEWSASATRQMELEAQEDEAKRQDEAAFAQALRDGTPDPGREAAWNVRAELEDVRRLTGALTVARDGAQADFRRAVEGEAPTLRAKLDREVAEANAEYLRAAQAVAAARSKVDRVQSVARWLEAYLTSGKSVTKVASGFLRFRKAEVSRAEVFATLEDDARPTARTPA